MQYRRSTGQLVPVMIESNRLTAEINSCSFKIADCIDNLIRTHVTKRVIFLVHQQDAEMLSGMFSSEREKITTIVRQSCALTLLSHLKHGSIIFATQAGFADCKYVVTVTS